MLSLTEATILVRRVARQISTASHVLLKNDNATLPLQCPDSEFIALIGAPAKTPLVGGGGSGSVVPSAVITPFDGITKLGEELCGSENKVEWAESHESGGVALAKLADVAIVLVQQVSGRALLLGVLRSLYSRG